ncbi:MAG: hypothetical protein COA78_36700 [Blastopirellula sp.]|nr:MAG: hypothetical protein COA78_36700 [Blastopirellula sp.]
MQHTNFHHWQTSSIASILPGGKLSFFVAAKRAKHEFVHGRIFVQWINFGHVAAANILTCRKSSETNSYNNKKTHPSPTLPHNPPRKFIHWINCPHQRGFWEKLANG